MSKQSMIQLALFAFINFLGAMSPGPDFAIVTRYGMSGSRRAAMLATLGISTALMIHVLYCLLGVAVFLKSSPLLFFALQVTGACYLGYLGIRMLMSKNNISLANPQSLGKKAFWAGFLTNLLNPKATIFILSLFVQFVTPSTSLPLKIGYGIIVPVSTMMWFCFLSYLLTLPTFVPHLQRHQIKFTRIMGCFLLSISGYVLVTSFIALVR